MIKSDKIFLLRLARKEIALKLKIDWNDYSNCRHVTPTDSIKEVTGTFVTLTIDDNLRGCIGQIAPSDTIENTIKENALSAAFYDPRFDDLGKDEFTKIQVELSILSKPQQLLYDDVNDLLSKVQKDLHGIIIRKGSSCATFLPQVWEDVSTKEDFLMHLCIKAGLLPDEWKKGKLDVYTYTVEHFNEKELNLTL